MDTLEFLGADARDDLKSIFQQSTMKPENSFAAFSDGDPLCERIKKVKPLKKYYDVTIHGSPAAVGFGTKETNMSPRLLASIIRHGEGWSGKIYACCRAALGYKRVMIIVLSNSLRMLLALL